MPRDPGHFESLTRELATRAARATLGQLGLTSDPLREHLRGLFETPAGAPGSFLAEPVFEARRPATRTRRIARIAARLRSGRR